MSKKFTLVLFMLSLFVLRAVPTFAQSALGFNGSGALAFTPNYWPVPGAGSNATIEFWVYTPTAVTNDSVIFVSQDGNTTDSGFFIGYRNNGIDNAIIVGSAPWHDPGPIFPIGQWNHIALAVDGAQFGAYLYLNGVLVDSMTVNSQPSSETYYTLSGSSGSGNPFQLGAFWNGRFPFNGSIDKVRIWDTIRTADQIKAGMYGTVSAATPHLVTAYDMDEGSGSTAATSVSGQVDLTLQPGVTWPTGPAISNPNGLTFDNTAGSGTGTIVSIPAKPAYDFNTGTIEFEVQPGSALGNLTIVANRGSGGSRWSVHMNNTLNHNHIGIWNQNAYDTVHFAPGFTPGTWYKVSLVTAPGASGDTTGVYVDGNYIGQIAQGYNTFINNQGLTIGGNVENSAESFAGGIDEVRLWNVALTPNQIGSYGGQTLTGTESGLVGYWNFDQGINAGDNTGLKVAVDNTPTTNNGLLNNNFALTGNTSNFVTHVLVPLPVTFGKFTVTKQGEAALLQWQTYVESNSKDFIIERSGNGSNYTDIGSVPAAGNSSTLKNYTFTDNTPLEGKNYYRLRQRDLDLKSSYSAVRVLAFSKATNLTWYTTGAKTAEIRLQNGSTELYTITDVSGQVIRKGRLSGGTTNLTGVASGIYFVKVINAAGAELNTKVLIP